MLKNGTWFLHAIDTLTTFSACGIVRNKTPKEILTVLFEIWISVFGRPNAFLRVNGGEFNNKQFRDMCENLSIISKTMAAYSPWSNGLCERSNSVIAEVTEKTIEETNTIQNYP